MRKKNKPLLERGKYRLEYDERRNGTRRSPYIQIVWYDAVAGRNRSRSTGTTDIGAAERQLDALYSEKEKGLALCPHCGQLMQQVAPFLVTSAIADYLGARSERSSYPSIKARLAHVMAYLEINDALATTCEAVDEEWIDDFRKWAINVPIERPNKKREKRAPGTVEASVRQLAAAVNLAKRRENTRSSAKFTAKKPEEVSQTPQYRADIATLARMFRYCTDPLTKEGESEKLLDRRINQRRQLLHFLQISVATWARPDAAHDVSVDPKRAQWSAGSPYLNLNPKGRTQTKKYRPIIPMAHQMAKLLDAHVGYYVEVASVRKAFQAMQDELGLPRDREAGMKLIRRSMAHLARPRLGEGQWIEGKIMLGHHRPDSSDIYAPFQPDYLAAVRSVTEGIIDDIIALAPKAFQPARSREIPSDVQENKLNSPD